MTAAVVAVLVWVAGGVGAGLRFMLDDVIRSRITAPTRWLRRWPVNVTGSLLLGLVTGLLGSHLLSHPGQRHPRDRPARWVHQPSARPVSKLCNCWGAVAT